MRWAWALLILIMLAYGIAGTVDLKEQVASLQVRHAVVLP